VARSTEALEAWVAERDWELMVTLTHPRSRDSWFFLGKIARFRDIWEELTGEQFEAIASVEATKRGRNHLHAAVIGAGNGTARLGSAHIPVDAFRRQQSWGMVDFMRSWWIPNELVPDWERRGWIDRVVMRDSQQSRVQLTLTGLRSIELDFSAAIELWYRSNYGGIAQVERVRDPKAVARYAIKYVLKDVHSGRTDWDFWARGIVDAPGSRGGCMGLTWVGECGRILTMPEPTGRTMKTLGGCHATKAIQSRNQHDHERG